MRNSHGKINTTKLVGLLTLSTSKGTSRQRSGKVAIRKRFPLQKKVQVGKDQEKAQSEKDSHSKNRGGKKQTNNQVLIP